MSPLRLPSIAGLALVLSGCASQDVVFATKTSLGVDVDAQSASVAYDRTEGYFAPRHKDKEAVPVFASVASDGKLLDRNIKQVYATGKAAKIVSAPLNSSPQPGTQQAFLRNTAYEAAATSTARASESPAAAPAAGVAGGAPIAAKSMFFGTGSLLGFKVGWGTGAAVDTFTFGYKRKEVSVIPHDENDKELPSVMASLDTGSAVAPARDGNFAVKQFFATGEAADTLANTRQIHDLFQEEAKDRLAEYREDERHQRDYALTSLACLSELDDSLAKKVWQNAKDLSLFDQEETDLLMAEANVGKQRSIYTRAIALTDATSSLKTGLMKGHMVFVCTLVKRA